MGARKRNKLKALLGKYEFPSSPPDFTKEVMKEIDALTDDRVFVNTPIKNLVQQALLPVPSAKFTSDVIKRVRVQNTAPVYKPVITFRVWMGIAAFIIVCLITAWLGNGDSGNSPWNSNLPVTYLAEWSSAFFEPLLYGCTIMLSIWLLLELDHFLVRTWRIQTTVPNKISK